MASFAPLSESLASFGHDLWWVLIIKVILGFAFLLLFTLFNIWYERRVVARMQHRLGPNVHGPFGLLQSLADGVKLMLKEDLVPKAVDTALYVAAPFISAVTAFMAIAVIPFGPVVRIPFTDIHTPLQITDLPVGVLYILAVTSVGVYGIVLAGWSSGSTYSLLGAVRSSAQVISYEVAMGLSFVAVFLYAGSLSTSHIVDAQEQLWYAIVLLPSFVIYVIAMVGETNRAPFDLPEAEGELVGGYHTEYSSIKFAFFFLAEYINMVTVSMLATTMFLGGWRAPWPLSLWSGANSGYLPALWFFIKLLLFIFFFVWLRGTLPRLRYDQFMQFGWKVLIPVGLVWVIAVGCIREITLAGSFDRRVLLGIAAAALVVFVILAFAGEERKRPEPEPESAEVDAYAGGYPVPPMPRKERVHG